MFNAIRVIWKQTLTLTGFIAGVSVFGLLILNTFSMESIIFIKEHWYKVAASILKIIGMTLCYSIFQYALGNKKCIVPVSVSFLLFCFKKSVKDSIIVLLCIVPGFLIAKFFVDPAGLSTSISLNYINLISIIAGVVSLSYLITILKQIPLYRKWNTSSWYE